jgi:hypothetical protein
MQASTLPDKDLILRLGIQTHANEVTDCLMKKGERMSIYNQILYIDLTYIDVCVLPINDDDDWHSYA